VQAVDTPGGGLTMRVTLPAAAEPAVLPVPQAPQRPGQP
jgi:hypothetical protein